MFIKKLSLLNYRSFDSRDFEFDKKINCFVGDNGTGKTNALDAIYHLCFGKSYFNPMSSQNIRHGEDFFVIDGLFEREGRKEQVVCSVKRGSNKVIKRNGKIYNRISDHIGLLPLVMISPADRDIIVEGSETRRKFINGVISQSDKNYLENLLKYQKILSQRNALLKYFSLNNTFDEGTLGVYDEQLHQYGTVIHQKRRAFADAFRPIFKEQYSSISSGQETIDLLYSSQLEGDELLSLLRNSIQKDRILQYTSHGVHRDDLKFTIDGHPIKKFGSQGQQKSFLIALKFAQFYFMKERGDTTPILLLDDIFDKLDEKRVARIVEFVDHEAFGQIFISDTHAERTEEVVSRIHQTYKIFSF